MSKLLPEKSTKILSLFLAFIMIFGVIPLGNFEGSELFTAPAVESEAAGIDKYCATAAALQVLSVNSAAIL